MSAVGRVLNSVFVVTATVTYFCWYSIKVYGKGLVASVLFIFILYLKLESWRLKCLAKPWCFPNSHGLISFTMCLLFGFRGLWELRVIEASSIMINHYIFAHQSIIMQNRWIQNEHFIGLVFGKKRVGIGLISILNRATTSCCPTIAFKF